MKKVYTLYHTYTYGPQKEHEEIKLLGIFESREMAEAQIEFYRVLPGFCDFALECFEIDEAILNKRYWDEGFVCTEE